MLKKILLLAIYITLLELIINYQDSIIFIVSAIATLALLTLICTIRLKILHNVGMLGQLNISILPLSLLAGTIAFLVFVPSLYFLQHIYIIITGILYMASISYVQKIAKDMKNRKSLAASDFLIVISAFLLYSSSFGLYLFLKWPTWQLMLILIVLTFILTYEYFWYNMMFEKHIVYTLILTLIISELAWALTLWPTGYISRSIVIFAIFYLFTNLSKHNFDKTLTSKVVRNNVIIGFIIVLLVVVTTKWTF